MRNSLTKLLFLLTSGLFLFLAVSCGGGGDDEGTGRAPGGDSPRINSLTPNDIPAESVAGTQITISGRFFGTTQGTGSVELRGEEVATANVVSWTDSQITIELPPNTPQGVLTVVVIRDDGRTSSVGSGAQLRVGDFDLPPPQVIGLDPSFGKVGDIVSITGSNFGSQPSGNRVTFAGSTAGDRVDASQFPKWTNTEIEVRVPDGARSGSVRVIIEGQASNPLHFTVQTGDRPAAPIVDSVSTVELDSEGTPQFDEGGAPVLTGDQSGFPPNSDAEGAPPRGSLVSIQGSGFGQNKGNSVVTFSGRFDRVVASSYFSNFRNNGWSNTQILVRVPQEAITGPIQVQVGQNRSSPTDDTVFQIIRKPEITGIQPFSIRFGNRFELFGRDFGPSPGTLEFVSTGPSGDQSNTFDSDDIDVWNDNHIVMEQMPVLSNRATDGEGEPSNTGFLRVITAEGRESPEQDFEIGTGSFGVNIDVSPRSGITSGGDPEPTTFTYTVEVLNESEGDYEFELDPGDGSSLSQTVSGPNPTTTFEVTYGPDAIDGRVGTISAGVTVDAPGGESVDDLAPQINLVRFDVALVTRVEVLIENEPGIRALTQDISTAPVNGQFQINERNDRPPFSSNEAVQRAYPLGSDLPAGYGRGLRESGDPLTEVFNTTGKSLIRPGGDDSGFRLGSYVPNSGNEPAIFQSGGSSVDPLETPVGYQFYSYDYGCSVSTLPCPREDGNDANTDQRVLDAESDFQAAFGNNAFSRTDAPADNTYGGLRIHPGSNFSFRRQPTATADNPVTNGDTVNYGYATQEPGLVVDYRNGANLGDDMPWEGQNTTSEISGFNHGNPVRGALTGQARRGPGATVGRPMIHPGDRVRIYGRNFGSEGDGVTGRILLHIDGDPDLETSVVEDTEAVEIRENGEVYIDDYSSPVTTLDVHAWGETAQVGDQELQYVELTMPRVDPVGSVRTPFFFNQPTVLNGMVRVDKDRQGTAGFSDTAAQFAPRIAEVRYDQGAGNFTPVTPSTDDIGYTQETIQLTVFDLVPPGYSKNVAGTDGSQELNGSATPFNSEQLQHAIAGDNLSLGIDDGFGYFQWYGLENTDFSVLSTPDVDGSVTVQFQWNAGTGVLPLESPIFTNNASWADRLTIELEGESQGIERPGGEVDFIKHDQDTDPVQATYRIALWSGHRSGFSSDGPRLVPTTDTQVNSGIISNPVELQISAP